MSKDKDKQPSDLHKQLQQLWELVRKLQDENEKLKEKIRAFYGN